MKEALNLCNMYSTSRDTYNLKFNELGIGYLDGLDKWRVWKKVVLQINSFVSNRERMETGEADQSWGGARS